MFARRCSCAHRSIILAARPVAGAANRRTMPTPFSRSPLADHGRIARSTTLASLFEKEPDRVERLAFEWRDWRLDLSKERLPLPAWRALVDHAEASGLAHWRDALFAGEKVN